MTRTQRAAAATSAAANAAYAQQQAAEASDDELGPEEHQEAMEWKGNDYMEAEAAAAAAAEAEEDATAGGSTGTATERRLMAVFDQGVRAVYAHWLIFLPEVAESNRRAW